MKSVIFATSSNGKVISLQRHLDQAGLAITVEQQKLDLIEPQADTAEEIALVKARQAYQQLGKAVLVDDSSFHITALNGFPGPYIKPMLTMIGVEGILQLMEGRNDRSASFISSLVYISDTGEEYVFNEDPFTGVIIEEATAALADDSWSDLHRIFIPTGATKVLSELTAEERQSIQPERIGSYDKLTAWLKENAVAL